jgi:hypothetical protein
MTLSKLAPIVLFTYNRPNHLSQTINSLKKNLLANESNLYIYSDGPKNNQDANLVSLVREYIKSIDGFKSINIIERDKNWGLANNIINGVTSVVNEYGKIIVLEDDLILSPYYLNFLNNALNHYKDEKKVWHISGYNLPFDSNGLADTYFMRLMICSGGWGTWADKWNYFERNPKKLLEEFSQKDIFHFNLEGARLFWNQVKYNVNGKLNTWAIFWYATIYKNEGVCLNPSHSYSRNIGYDSLGTHTKDSTHKDNITISHKEQLVFETEINESELAVCKLKTYYKTRRRSIITRALSKLKKLINQSN